MKPSDMRQHILETVNVIVQKRSLKGEPYLWQNGYILNIKKRKRCFRFGCCYICRLHKKSFTFECYFEMIFCRISYLCYSYASFKICKNMFLRFNWFFGMNRFVTYCCEKRELAKGSGSGKPKLRAKFSHQNDLGELDNA